MKHTLNYYFSCLVFLLSAQFVSAQTNETDSLALVTLYNECNGANWNHTWDFNLPVSEWEGVTVEDNRVTILDLAHDKLNGQIPTELGNLSELTELDLSFNDLTGSLISELGNLIHLTKLDFAFNEMSGTIPEEIWTLVNLKALDIGYNNFSGSIPSELGNLTQLESLWLANNQFEGNIPAEFVNLTELRSCYLLNNQFSGNLPSDIGNLTKLKNLYINSNQFEGDLPVSMGEIDSLENMILSNNNFSGTVPLEYGNLAKLKQLSLGQNNLEGTIPDELQNLSNLRVFGLNNNNIEGEIPLWLGNLSELSYIYLEDNNLTGTIPVELGNLTNLEGLDLGKNSLEGTIPVELGNLSSIERIELNDNQLTGDIPSELGNLSTLNFLWLQNNELTGSVPESFSNLNNLHSLYLENNSLTSLPDLSGLPEWWYTYGFTVQNNNLRFNDIIPNLVIVEDDIPFVYSPQADIDDEIEESVVLGSEYIMEVSDDVDGTLYQWFKNEEEITGANASTYVINSFSENDAGIYHCELTHPDVPDLTLFRNAIDLSAADEIVVEKYEMSDLSLTCDETVFCHSVDAVEEISNTIGFDVTIAYDNESLIPTGNFNFSEDLINDTEYISFSSNAENNTGLLNISIYLNSAAPSNTVISGLGEVFCVEFERTESFVEGSTEVDIISVMESYVTGVGEFEGNAASVNIEFDTEFSSNIKYWNDDVNLTSINNVTIVNGMDENCNPNGNSVVTDENGFFTFDLLNESINISRDIPGDYEHQDEAVDVMEEINGADAVLLEKILIKDDSFLPSAFQMLAADVNMDGFISAGDLSQLNQRTILSLSEFKQAWNYNSDNTPNGNGLSYDWLFVDAISLSENETFSISSTYPEDDGIGYSKFNLPDWSLCIAFPIDESGTCPQVTETHYKAILLGDIDGNWSTSSSDLLRQKRSKTNVVFNLEEAVNDGEFVQIPVQIEDENIQAMDLLIPFDETKLEFISLTNMTQVSMKEHVINNTLRITSFSQESFPKGTILNLKFKVYENEVKGEDFGEIKAFVNGNLGNALLEGSQTLTALEMNDVSSSLSVYPNPTRNSINLEFTDKLIGNTQIKLLDVNGKVVYQSARFEENIDISVYASGIYMLQLVNQNNVAVKRVVKN